MSEKEIPMRYDIAAFIMAAIALILIVVFVLPL